MYKYISYLPNDYHKQENLSPLLIFLHGTPQRGSDFSELKKVGIPKLLEKGDFKSQMIVIAPLCPKFESWDSASLFSIYKLIEKKYRIDTKRVYITGFSMGGFGALKFAKEYPYIFAAMAPVCSGGSKYMSEYIAHIPTWFFHGKKDEVIEFEKTKELVDKLKELKSDVRFTEYEKLGHEIWEKVYGNMDLYDWFLNYSK